MLNAKLLMGDSEIVIGSEGYQSFSVGGDVFGAGDFCDITGNSTITFEDFSQDGRVLSIQKVDELNIVRSTVHLDGNMDGSQTTGSPMLSLNLIGQLNLVGDGSEAGRSQLIVEAAAANISGYSSTYTSTSVETRNYNVLKINSGMVFSILGDDGESDGFIEGHTVLASDDNDYFGALVMGLKEILKDDPTFWVLRDGKYEETKVSDQAYTMGEVRSWYLDGSYKVQQTVLFTNSSDATLSERTSFMLPKVRTGSTISFAGYYINPYSPGSLDIVPASGISDLYPGSWISLNFGSGSWDSTSGSGGKTLFGTAADGKNYSGLDLAQTGDDVVPAAINGGAGLDMTLSTYGGFNRTGYIGSITLYFVEMNGSLAVNIFDVEVKVYLRIAHGATDSIKNEVVMHGDSPWTGTVDVYLPFLANNAIGEYTITNVDSSGTLEITTVATNLNRDGWNSSKYRESPLEISGSTNESLRLGTGGVFSPVLRISYSTKEINLQEDGSFKFDDVVMTITLVQEGLTSPINTIEVTISPEMVTTVDVVFMDRVLDLTQTSAWTDYHELFSLTIDFGSLVSDYFLIVDTSKWVYPVLQTGQIADVKQTQDFIDSIKGSLTRDNDGSVLVSTNKESLGSLATGGKQVMSVEELLSLILESKPNTAYKDGNVTLSFDYSANYPGWYDTSSGYSRFNFGSEITEDLSIYAGYSVTITVHKHPESPGTVNTTYLFPGAPGTPVNLNDHSDVALGYDVVGWYLAVDNGDGKTSYKELTADDVKEFRTFSNVDLYVMLKPLPYKVTVKVEGGYTDIALYEGENPVSPITVDGETYYQVHVGTEYSIVVAGIPDGSHISSVTANGGTWNTFDTNGNKVIFKAPAMDLDIKIEIVQEYTVTVTMPSSGGNHDNEFYGFDENGKLVEGGAIKGIVLKLKSDSTDVTISMPPNDTVISVYGSDGKVVRYGYAFIIDVSELTGDVEYELYVNKVWNVKYGTGYTAYIDSRVDHKGVPLEGFATQTKPGQAYTGDVITLQTETDYQFGSGFTAVGVVLETDGVNLREYSVNTQLTGGKSDVVFGNAEKSVIMVTVNVSFTTRGEIPRSEPTGGIIVSTADGASVATNKVSWTGGIMTYTFTAIRQTYQVSGNFHGYGDTSDGTHYVAVEGDGAVVKLVFSAVPQKVVFSDGGNVLHTYDDWRIDDTVTINQMYSGAGEYFAWAYSGGILDIGDDLDLSMFGDDGMLVLVGLPHVQDEGREVLVMAITVYQGQLLGNGHSILVGDYDTVEVPSDSEIDVSLTGDYITLKSGNPGTGEFKATLEGSGKVLYLYVTVIKSVVDIG